MRDRVEGYKKLVQKFGEGRLADAILAKWLSDPDATDQWVHLAGDVFQKEVSHDQTARNQPTKIRRGDKLHPLSVPRNPGGLSERQIEILEMYAAGMSDNEIAEALNLTYNQVKNATKLARRELSAVSTTHAVAKAIRKGVILPPQERAA